MYLFPGFRVMTSFKSLSRVSTKKHNLHIQNVADIRESREAEKKGLNSNETYRANNLRFESRLYEHWEQGSSSLLVTHF